MLVYTRRERPYRFLAEQVRMPPDLTILPPPVPPRPVARVRDYHDWLPLHLELTAFTTGQLEELFLLEGNPATDERVPEEDAAPRGQGWTNLACKTGRRRWYPGPLAFTRT